MISNQSDGKLRLAVFIQPGASKSEIVGPHNGSLKIRIQSPPVDGKANEALIQFLAKALGIPKRAIQIVKGETQRNKLVEIEGIDRVTLEALIQPRPA